MEQKYYKELNIPYQNKDILQKYLVDSFKNTFFKFIGIVVDDNVAIRSVPNDISFIESFQERPDRVYLIGDKILDFEFDSTGNFTSMSKYMLSLKKNCQYCQTQDPIFGRLLGILGPAFLEKTQ
jgi:hypothetical protein